MVLLTGFTDLGRIYFCSHSNRRKTNWIWFLFQYYIAPFFLEIKTLNSLLWSLFPLVSILSFSSFFYIGHTSLGEGGAALWAEGGKEHSWRWSKVVVGEARWLCHLCHHPAIHMGWELVPGKGTGADYSSWKVIAGLSWSNWGDDTEGRQDWSGSAAVLSASGFGTDAGETLQRAVCSSLIFSSFIPHLTPLFFPSKKKNKLFWNFSTVTCL